MEILSRVEIPAAPLTDNEAARKSDLSVGTSIGMFTLYVDENGYLCMVTVKGGSNPFRYDEETGDLYYRVPRRR